MIRYLHPADHNPRKIRKVGKNFAREIDFKNIKFPVKIRDIHKIEKKNYICISVFGYENKQNYPIYMSKKTSKRHVDLLLIEEEGKRQYVLILAHSFKIIHHIVREKLSYRYCLQAFSAKEILKCHIIGCFKLMYA